MSELADFLRMGGYAAYVWSSYALTLVVIGGIVWWSARELRATREETLKRARTRARSASHEERASPAVPSGGES